MEDYHKGVTAGLADVVIPVNPSAVGSGVVAVVTLGFYCKAGAPAKVVADFDRTLAIAPEVVCRTVLRPATGCPAHVHVVLGRNVDADVVAIMILGVIETSLPRSCHDL